MPVPPPQDGEHHHGHREDHEGSSHALHNSHHWKHIPCHTSVMPTVSGSKYLRDAIAEIKQRTARGEKVAVAFDVDNTLVDTRGRVLAIGKAFDKANGTHYFKGKTSKSMGNDAKETAKLLKMTDAHSKKFSALFFREFFKGENYANDTQIKSTISLAKRAAAAGADVFYVTARTQSEETFTIKQLEKAGLPDVDASHVVSEDARQDDGLQSERAEDARADARLRAVVHHREPRRHRRRAEARRTRAVGAAGDEVQR
ncbi:MAG: HAD family acid phosphatase [Archangium sp.]